MTTNIQLVVPGTAYNAAQSYIVVLEHLISGDRETVLARGESLEQVVRYLNGDGCGWFVWEARPFAAN